MALPFPFLGGFLEHDLVSAPGELSEGVGGVVVALCVARDQEAWSRDGVGGGWGLSVPEGVMRAVAVFPDPFSQMHG